MKKQIYCAVISVLPMMSTVAHAEHDEAIELDQINVVEKRLYYSTEAARLLNEIEAERSATPGAVTAIDGESLQTRNVGQLADMLRYVPGVYASSYNGNDDVFYSSRGSNLDATDWIAICRFCKYL